tara:strand:- start:2398 stop:3165 length:768 start_codon:yes stop_codon:yes gene_type:complete
MNNFGNIKDTFNDILTESLLNKDKKGKKLFSQYLNILKEDNNLRNEYLIFKNLTSVKFKNETDAIHFINENIELLKNNDSSQGLKKLKSLLKGKNINVSNSELYEHINTLRNTEKTPETLIKLQKSLNYLSENMLKEVVVEKNEFDTVDVPPSVLTKMATNRFNLKYQDITEGEKEIIKTILNGNDEDKKEVYNNLKTECIDIIDKKLNENVDLDIKDKLLKVKDKLLRMTYSSDEYVKDINNVYELKNSVATEE